jgi:tetratricopeptide (TPR) repeat protein
LTDCVHKMRCRWAKRQSCRDFSKGAPRFKPWRQNTCSKTVPKDQNNFGSSQTGASVFYGLGISAYHRGEIEVALKFLARACADPEAPAIWHRNHAEMLDRHGRPAAAEAAARLAVRCDSNSAKAWETLGTILFQRGSLEESCSCYEAAVRIDATFVQALNNLAVTLYSMGLPESAEKCYRQALAVKPDSAEIQLNLATLLGELGRDREGLKIVREVLERHPNLMTAHSLVRGTRAVSRRPRSTPRHVRRSWAKRPH